MKKEYEKWLVKIIPSLFEIKSNSEKEYLKIYNERIKIRDKLLSISSFEEIPNEYKKFLHL